MRETTLFPLPV